MCFFVKEELNMISTEELKSNKKGKDYSNGYRIVSFYPDGSYYIGEYCKTIEGFMIGLSKCDPIISDEDTPKFVSYEDLLKRNMSFDKKAIGCAIYKVDGTLIYKI